jgi:uncharacterized protein
MHDVSRLQHHLSSLGRVVLGYSGGVDSAVLAVAGSRTLGPERFLAVIGRSASYPEAQWRTAHAIAREFGVPLREILTEELSDPRYLANPVDRCYFCKSELWVKLGDLARTEGFNAVIDGTNADDLGEHRPGLAAAVERGVGSPLAELGWTKAMVRAAAQQFGLPLWDAPASPCLSSRIRYGLSITPARLRQVEEGEAMLRALGVRGNLRVRHHGDHASIEAGRDEMAMLQREWDRISGAFRSLGFARVALDPQGYRRGGLLELTGATN